MADTRRQSILAALAARVAVITKANDFNTDAGDTVYLGETPELGPEDPFEAIALVVGEDDVKSEGRLSVTLPIVIAAIVKADLDAPWLAVEAILADIKRAVELEDRTLGALLKSEMRRGSTRTLPREAGSTTVGASVTYLCPYYEIWGEP